ncbi:MAG TPA: acetate kinase [Firmicutes bacterium]|nr:acetate kinase [Bacillota bacterium]
MKILVINAGSSSLKYQLIDMETETPIAKGLCERIGIGGKITHKTSDGRSVSYEVDFPTHEEAFAELTKVLTTGDTAVIKNLDEISAIGHRVVQGGEKITQSVLLTEDVLKVVDECAELAPLHNPPILVAIRACQKVFSDKIPQVGVFDTAFHQTMPQKAYTWAIPYEYYEKYHIRRYGYHGTSHRFVSGRLGELVGGLEGKKVVTCHLGNGSSICAIVDGKCMENSMGFTPLDGLIMGTRSGSVDPSVVAFIANKEGLSAQEVVDILNKKSGYLGVSGFTSDQRDLWDAAEKGNARAQLALDMQVYQIKKYIGAYAAAMGGLDYVVFTGGIGENDMKVRELVCSDMEFLGIKFAPEKNNFRGEERIISTDDSKVTVYVLPTNEELLIARDTAAIVGNK